MALSGNRFKPLQLALPTHHLFSDTGTVDYIVLPASVNIPDPLVVFFHHDLIMEGSADEESKFWEK